MTMLAPRSKSTPTQTVLKVIVFSIAGYRLALPLESVLRVVNAPVTVMPSSANEPLNGVELVHLKHLAISVLNLYSHLSLKQVDSIPQYGQFLIVTQAGGELCALRVDTPPDLIELDAATLRQLPAPYQQHHPLSIASRVAVLPQGKATSVIFLLDMERVLQVIGG